MPIALLDNLLKSGASVTTPLGLFGLIVVSVLLAYRRKLLSAERRIKSLSEDDRLQYIDEWLTRYRLDASNLSGPQKTKLIYRELSLRESRTKLIVIVVAVVIIACFGLTIMYLSHAPSQVSLANVQQEKVLQLANEIKNATPAIARNKLIVLEDYVNQIDSLEVRQAALKQLVGIVFSSTQSDPRVRAIRAATIATIDRLKVTEMANMFGNHELESLDLVGVNFSNMNLRGVSFKDAFLIQSDFSGATLDGTDFSGAFLRNCIFKNASLRNTNFSNTDWFNASGLEFEQLKLSKTSSLISIPKSEAEFLEFLPTRYQYDFEGWSDEIKSQLRSTWGEYLKPGGLRNKLIDTGTLKL